MKKLILYNNFVNGYGNKIYINNVHNYQIKNMIRLNKSEARQN